MLAADEDAVICDFAETYHVLDIGALDLPLAATLAAGLAPDSRIMRKLSGSPLPQDIFLLAAAVDRLSMLQWFGSQDGANGVNRPRSILAALTGAGETREVLSYPTAEAFEQARAAILRGQKHGD